MMLALGLGGWLAGMFHLFTHAFFKALLVPLLRLGDPRHGHQRDAADGRPAEEDALDRRHDARRLPGDRRGGHPAGRRPERLLLQGRHPRPGPVVQASQSAVRLFLLDRRRRGGDYGLLHVPPVVHDLCRRAPRRARLSPRPRVAVGDGRAAGGAGLLRRRGRLEPLGNFGLPPLLEQARPLGTEHGASAGWSSPIVTHPVGARIARARASTFPPRCWAFGSALAGFLLATVFYGLRKLEPGRRQPAVRRHRIDSSSTSGGSTSFTPCSSSVPRCGSPTGSPPATSRASTAWSTAWRGSPASSPGWTNGSIAFSSTAW